MRLRVVLVLTASIFLSDAFAQTPSRYTLKQVLELALQQNANIARAKYDYQEGEQKTREVKSAALPQVNISGDVTNNVIRQAFVFPAKMADPNAGEDDYLVLRAGMQHSATATLQATQQIFNQSVFTGIKAAKVSEEYYRNNIERTEEEVIQQTSSLFYQVASMQAQRNVIETNLEQTKKNLDITTSRFENGVARKLDVDRLKVNVTNLQTQLRSVDDAFSSLTNQLKLVAGMDINTPLEVAEPLIEASQDYQIDASLTAGDWAFENKIEFRQLSTQLELYDLERKSFSSGYFPTLSLFGNYSYTAQSNDFFLKSGINPLTFDIASIGLRLSIPVFDGFNKSAKVQQSKIHRMKTENDMAFTRQQSNMEFVNSVKSYETSFESYEAQKANVELANSVYDVTLQNYNEGVSSLTDLLQAESSRIQAQNQLIEALLKVKQAEVALLKSKGEIKNLLN